MVIAGTINRVAFYCRVNHRDRDYEKYLDDVMRRLEEEYGKQKHRTDRTFLICMKSSMRGLNVKPARVLCRISMHWQRICICLIRTF